MMNPRTGFVFLRKRRDESGINMVDLMMWLVIAALLLAVAIQGIGYYQKAANLNNMKSDASGAGTNVIAAASMAQGTIDVGAVTTGASASNWTKGVTHTVEESILTGKKPYIRVSASSVKDVDVLYLFEPCAGYEVGVNVVPKASSLALQQCGVDMAGTQPIKDNSAVMVSVWDTTRPGCSTISLPLEGTVNTNVDWGDGASNNVTTQRPTHTYGSGTGQVLIKVTGTFTKFGSGSTWVSKTCINRVTGWGDTKTTDLNYAFSGTTYLTAVAQIPPTAKDLRGLFSSSVNFNGDVSNWDTSKVEDMSSMFGSARSFNGDISRWNTSSLNSMSHMFLGASSFNQNLTNFDTSRITNMQYLFTGATVFNGDISNWDTSKVTDMSIMFSNAGAFNGDISKWDTSSLTTTSSMFSNALKFNQDISQWKTFNVTNMDRMFYGALAFDRNITGWDTSKVTNMTYMFYHWTPMAFKQDISGWNVALVTVWGGTRDAFAPSLPISSVPLKFR